MVFDSIDEAMSSCRSMEKIQSIEATSGSMISMGNYESSINALRRKANRIGANGIYIIDHSKNQMADSVTGKAIHCELNSTP